MDKYLHTLENAKEVRRMPLIVPAYFRLVELLTRQGQTTEALHFIDMWYGLAAGNGHAGAAVYRDDFARQMTPAQIAEAAKLAREWKSTTP